MNTNIIQKLWLYSGLFFTLLMVQLILMMNLSSQIKKDMNTNIHTTQPITDNFHQLQISVIQTQQWLTDISATRGLDGLDDGFKEAENSAQLFTQAINNLARLDPEQASQYHSLEPVYKAYYDTGVKMAQAYVREGPQGGNKLMSEFDTTAEAIYSKVDEFQLKLKQSNAAKLEKQIAESKTLETMNYIFSIGYLILLSILIVGGIFYVTNPAKKLVQSLKRIASGDLTQTVEYKNQDELGDIANNTNKIVTDLGGILANVASQGALIGAYSQATNLVVNDTANGIDRQRIHASEITRVISGMNQSVEQIDSLSIQAKEQALQASKEANAGKKVVEESILAINSLASDLKLTEQSIQSLEQDSIQISTVLKVIQDIAEQTNLLALNAAIEAARAGEQGRGFAVVADEVRTLAARTQGSAQEIKAMIEGLQKGTKESVDMMEKSYAKAQSTVEQSEKAGQSLQTIADSVNQINEMNNQIATATHSQKTVSHEVNDKVSEIIKLIEEVQHQSDTATSMGKQTRQHASEFSSLILGLKVIRNAS